MQSGAVQTASRSASEEEERRAGERLTATFCADCHALSAVTTERRTASEWLDLVERMASRAGEATRVDVAAIGRYLARTRGIVSVNTAPAADFVSVLGLSSEMADTVVAYRAAHDKIGDLDTFLKISGLDNLRLEGNLQALRFD